MQILSCKYFTPNLVLLSPNNHVSFFLVPSVCCPSALQEPGLMAWSVWTVAAVEASQWLEFWESGCTRLMCGSVLWSLPKGLCAAVKAMTGQIIRLLLEGLSPPHHLPLVPPSHWPQIAGCTFWKPRCLIYKHKRTNCVHASFISIWKTSRAMNTITQIFLFQLSLGILQRSFLDHSYQNQNRDQSSLPKTTNLCILNEALWSIWPHFSGLCSRFFASGAVKSSITVYSLFY